MNARVWLWAVGVVAFYVALADRVCVLVLSHTHQRALGAVAVTLVLMVAGWGLARLGIRFGRAALPLGVAVAVGCFGATYLGVFASRVLG